MAKKSGLASKSTAKALSRISLFGPPPLLEKEDAASYQKLLARVSRDLRPNDILEEIWILDVVNLSWEVIRWHRLKAKLLDLRGFENAVDHIERVDRLAMAAEARRNAALREIDRHRTSLAQNLRQKIQEAQDVEFELVEAVEPADLEQKKVA